MSPCWSLYARAHTHTHTTRRSGWHVSTVTVSIAAARLGREGSLWAAPEVELGERVTVPGGTLHA